ncbi:unnamed protein product, partial [Nippostrongylus brasiliensis]|uniref:Integrase catalytic domain-containing protein n=1 Tax=Nippostrongylus brasiliensis TaxID=27835 RepID=A0A0N4Y498_NIPBR
MMDPGQGFQLSTSKRRMTLFCKKLDSTLAEAREVISNFENQKLAQEKLTAIETFTNKVEEAQKEYAAALDNSERTPSAQEAVDYEQYLAMSEMTLLAAYEVAVQLRALLRSSSSTSSEHGSTTPSSSSVSGQSEAIVNTPRNVLPAIPIPSFTGKTWEWDNFWTLFNANVHSQPIPDLFKFNHLLNALKGEPRQAILRFQVSEENYTRAIDFLKAKYSDKETILDNLIQRLEATSLQSTSLKDQRILLDHLHVVIAQLRSKGEQVDGQWLVKQVLAKFPQQVQREILRRKCSMEEPFSMQWLLDTLDKYISCEEKIATLIPNDKGKQPAREERPAKGQSLRQIQPCMYCNQPHKAASCTRYSTPQERANYLRQHKLCMICASPQHSTEECKRRNCFTCQGRHHTSCCFRQKIAPEANPTQQNEKQPSTTAKPKARNNNPRQQRQVKQFTTQYHEEESSEQENEEDEVGSIAEFHASKKLLGIGETFLPIGELTIMDPSTRKLRKISALLDSGAECSFIDQKLADELNLPEMSKTTLRVRTFGAPNDLECQTRKVSLDVWDSEGEPCQLQLLTHNILTSSLRTPPILEEDATFIRQNQLQVHVVSKRKAKPQILLGSDQLWQLIHADKPHVRLPSGLYLLPTRLGHLLTGQLQVQTTKFTSNETREDEKHLPEEGKAINSVSMADPELLQAEQSAWERYWKIQDEGQEEFIQPEKNVQELIDRQVHDEFLRTVQRREDGYYVRLPWKEIPVALPDNRAIAVRRLASVWNSLQKDKQLLDKYHETFQEQLRLNIIEEVDVMQQARGRIHYLPHQAVLTPQKSTTKLRVVFDASAHYKNSPSLNDALHRGPVLLPKLYGLLLRFRIGKIAIIADVEKAFLQVRLQEQDRDATRCLWLKDYRRPPSEDNIQVYRFTRIAFGLLSSPFLLAATTYHHLDQYPEESKLVEEIKQNLYVDNVILTSDTPEDGLHVYSRTKAIFKDLSMNLREFTSNNSTVMETIQPADKASDNNPKVLGIEWKANQDKLQLVCRVVKQNVITKRSVASTIASIVDPMGWMLPIVHKARVFLQSLWKQNFKWDEQLPQALQKQWQTICEDMDGFKKQIPRFLLTRASTTQLVVSIEETNHEAEQDNPLPVQREEQPQGTNVLAQIATLYVDIFQDIKRAELQSIKRIVAFVLRFIHNTISRHNSKETTQIQLSPLFDEAKPSDSPIPEGLEIKRATKMVAKQHQLAWIAPTTQAALKHLNLYVDHQGILRCRGRLGKSAMSKEAKFPMLVLQKTWLSRLIIEDCHAKQHPGISHTMCKVREQFWIPKLRAEVTSILRKCVQCQRFNNLPFSYPDQGALPSRRVTKSRPFEHVGLDYFGPLTISNGTSTDKCFGIIVTCLATRLIHLDIVQDASTLAFLQALRRFFARRGVPQTITSDNAPTFVLGDEVLANCFAEASKDPAIAKEVSSRAIQWQYITPYAPWQGGVYERLIRSVKLAMYKSLGKLIPTKEELLTLLVEIEAMLNTRPLVHVEAEEQEQQVLRPIDFLQNQFEVAPPLKARDEDLQDPEYETPAERAKSLTKKQLMLALASSVKNADRFWEQWQHQYLTSLREQHTRTA